MRLLTRTAMAAAMFASVGMLSAPAQAIVTTTGPLAGVVTLGPVACIGLTSCNSTANGGGYNFTFSLPAFNSSFGTLQSFTISLNAVVSGDATLTNTAPTSPLSLGFIELSGTGFKAFLPNPSASAPFKPFSTTLPSVSLAGLNATPAIDLFSAGITSLTIPALSSVCFASDGKSGCTVNNNLKAIANTSVVDSAVADLTAALSGFTISGSTIGFQFQTSVSGLTYNANVFSQEQVSVNYTYAQACGTGTGQTGIPCPTPEPASLSLLGIGLLSLAGIVRRRRKS